MRILPILALVLASGCVTLEDLAACARLTEFTHPRFATFYSNVIGRKNKDTANRAADSSEPSAAQPLSCMEMMARRRELKAQ